MSATYEHPSLRLQVTPEQRERAEHYLQEAYADRRITEDEFDRRIGQVISADNRKELNEAFYGLVPVSAPSQALGVHPAYQPLVRPETRQQAGRGVGGLAHFSGLCTWAVGPGLLYAMSPSGSYQRREAAKAFNFQIITAISFVLVGIVESITKLDLDVMLALMFLGWFVLTIVGGAKALQGANWRNPVKSVLKLELLSEK
jgi:uncharacterized Tic20 family protein